MSNNSTNNAQDIISLKIISRANSQSKHYKCHSICFTSQSGQMQVLANHIPVIASIQSNTQITIIDEQNTSIVLNMPLGGFFTFNQNHCLITVQNYSIQSNGGEVDSEKSKENLKKAS